jgi:tRNA-dihydrouridine synthase B
MKLISFMPEERPIGVQLFGSDPGIMKEAARMVSQVNPDFIDLNFGCPAKKVVKQGAGAAVLNDLARLRRIVKSVISATKIPVTVKIRSGWNEKHIVAVQVARILEEEGAAAVTVHPRTRKMGFKGKADLEIIRKVRESVSMPVIGNGDVVTPADAKKMLEQTGCDLVMIGQGSLGRPWIFRLVNQYLETGEILKEPTYRQRVDICLKHYKLALEFLGEERAVKEMRKHIGWYLKGLPGSHIVKQNIFNLEEPEMVESSLRHYREHLKE